MTASIGAIHALWALQGLGQPRRRHARRRACPRRIRACAAMPCALSATIKRCTIFSSASGVISDPDPRHAPRGDGEARGVSDHAGDQNVVARLAAEPTVQRDEWLEEAARMLVRKHKAITYQEGPNLLPNPGFEIVERRQACPRAGSAATTARTRRDAGTRVERCWRTRRTAARSAVRCITRGDADTSLYAGRATQATTRDTGSPAG